MDFFQRAGAGVIPVKGLPLNGPVSCGPKFK